MNIIISALLAGMVLLAISLQRAYSAMPVKELKRRARQQDQTAALLYQAATYGVSLRVLLWVVVGLSSAWFFVFTSQHMSGFLSLVICGLVVWVGFIWLPQKEVKRLSLWFAKTLAPVFAWILQYAHSPISKVIQFVRKHHPVTLHTGLYDKEDLLDLLNNQNVQAGNRIEQYELELAFQALTFGDKLVSDFLTPRRMVRSISVDESIGPLLMDELHSSGFSRFPVYQDKEQNFVGTLFLRDLVKTKSTAKVKDVMRKEVCYVHEDQTLYDALQAILKTHHHLLLVVNGFEEYVGVISIEDVLEQVIGRSIQDEFDQYDDLRAVASRAAKKEHAEHVEPAPPVTTGEEVIE